MSLSFLFLDFVFQLFYFFAKLFLLDHLVIYKIYYPILHLKTLFDHFLPIFYVLKIEITYHC